MPILDVFIGGQWGESKMLTIPVEIFSPSGDLLARGVASPTSPLRVDLSPADLDKHPDAYRRIYVVGRLPSGDSIQEFANFHNRSMHVELKIGDQSPHEWLEWVVPMRGLGHLMGSRDTNLFDVGRIGHAWMTLWEFNGGRWSAGQADIQRTNFDGVMRMWTIQTPKCPSLLQIGGEKISWRLISLPPNSEVRVALTASIDGLGDPLEISIGRTRAGADMIMSYLSNGASLEAAKLVEALNAADLMLYQKLDDPISAVIGAYCLLKYKQLGRRKDWVYNLVNWFPEVSDGPIVAAAMELRSGENGEAVVRSLINLAIQRGLPIFSIGMDILVETMAAIHLDEGESQRFHNAYLAAQAYARAASVDGPYFSFNGKSPVEPSWTSIFGTEQSPHFKQSHGDDDVEVVMFSRPPGSKKSVRFGGVQVKLPLVPVSPDLARKLFAGGGPSLGYGLTSDYSLRRSVDFGIRSLQTDFLEKIGVDSGESDVANFTAGTRLNRQVLQVASEERGNGEPALEYRSNKTSTPRKRKQTEKYWNDERGKFSFKAF